MLISLAFSPLVTPVFAEPNDSTSEEATADPAAGNAESSDENSSETTSETTETTSETVSSSDTNVCYDASGALGWVICAASETLSGFVDTIYDFISDILAIQPISSEADSPVYQVWSAARNITNVVFIILLLIVVYSQITGFGINNYGIKKVLPRIIIAAVLINLSFIICQLAIDISNILGVSLKGFFDGIRENVMANTSVDVNWSDLIAWIFGGGVAAIGGITAASIAAGGSIIALFWMAFPLLIAAVAAVFVGVFTIALRQGIVALLVMISPLAFVCFLLPNTEKLFQRWKDIFLSMLIFYPMFSVLYGAAGLAGWVLISSADNAFWIIIGLAVQVLPLFASVSLMKMSGTILGKVSGALSGATRSAKEASRRFSADRVALNRARVAAKPPSRIPIAPRNLSRSFERRKYRRLTDTAKYQAAIDQQNINYAENVTNKDGELTRRGRRLQAAEDAASMYMGVNTETNRRKVQDRYNRQHSAIVSHANGQMTDYYKNMSRVATSTGLKENEGISAIVSNAISEQVAANRRAMGNYEDLFNNYVVASETQKDMEMAFASKNALALQAGFASLAMTDADKVIDVLRKHSDSINSTEPEDIAMQKAIANALRGTPDTVVLSGYSKAIDKSRNKADAINTQVDEVEARNVIHAERGEPLEIVPDRVARFISFNEFENDDPKAVALGVDRSTIIRTQNKINIAALQGKTTWDDAKNRNELLFTDDQRAYAIFNEPGGGEVYQYLIDNHLGKGAKWVDKDTRHVLKFTSFEDPNSGHSILSDVALAEARDNVHRLMKVTNSNQISKFNMASLEPFATIMNDDYTTSPDGSITFDNTSETDRFNRLVAGVQRMQDNGDFRPNLASDLRRRADRGQLETMDPEVRRVLNAVLHFE